MYIYILRCTNKKWYVLDMGFPEIKVEALPGDVMAGGGGTAGPAQEIRHQPPGDASLKQYTVTIYTTKNHCKTLMH